MVDKIYPIRILERRKALNMSQEELASIVGYGDRSSIAKIEKGLVDLTQSKLIEIAKALKVKPAYLLGWDDNVEDIINIPGAIPLNLTKRIPILGYISCGSFSWSEENFEGFFMADKKIKADYCLVARGDSMIDAGIDSGDIVFLKHSQTVDSGKIAAIRIGEETTLKKVLKINDTVVLQPCNNRYEPILLNDTSEAIVVGEVVGIYKTLDY